MAEKITSEILKETCIVATLPSGLKCYICPQENKSSAYALFGTKYGSIDTAFSVGEEEPTVVPDGIAHFLEHKLFESEERDAFTLFSETGANANAYTSFDRTCYLFSCSSRFYENLEILTNFVTHPYFTPETVEKEQGIIGQEIKMYEDSPGWRVFFNTLTAMYEKCSVKTDIAGSVESIRNITAELLYKCYNTFYDPSNMFLCVAGNVDADKVLEIAGKIEVKDKPIINRVTEKEPDETVKEVVEQKLAVSMPQFSIGIKEHIEKPLPSALEATVANITANVLFGKSSPIYKELLKDGLVNESFDSEYFFGRGYSATIIGGDSNEPQKVFSRIKDYIEKVKVIGVGTDAVETAKRREYGRGVRKYNTPDDTVGELVDCAVYGFAPFSATETVNEVTAEAVNARIKAIDTDKMVLSVVRG